MYLLGCKLCDKTFNTKADLEKHISKKHTHALCVTKTKTLRPIWMSMWDLVIRITNFLISLPWMVNNQTQYTTE
jgi:hypothetical protein